MNLDDMKIAATREFSLGDTNKVLIKLCDLDNKDIVTLHEKELSRGAGQEMNICKEAYMVIYNPNTPIPKHDSLVGIKLREFEEELYKEHGRELRFNRNAIFDNNVFYYIEGMLPGGECSTTSQKIDRRRALTMLGQVKIRYCLQQL